jgi:phosphoribosylaminoimidazole-succinocarboxamide synthase
VRKELLYEGKAKKIYSTELQSEVVVEYKDSLTAFNALKKGSFAGKGALNLRMTALLFEHLSKNGVPTHLIKQLGPTELLVKKVEIIPLEVVVRNVLAGSTAKKFGIEEGQVLAKPLVEFYFKNDALADPFLSDDQALMLGIVKETEIPQLKTMALKVNDVLAKVMNQAGMTLVDFKIEIGREGNRLLLADEISPDCCRLWDKKTGEKMDKDRFRRDLGNVAETYQEVCKRLSEVLK